MADHCFKAPIGRPLRNGISFPRGNYNALAAPSKRPVLRNINKAQTRSPQHKTCKQKFDAALHFSNNLKRILDKQEDLLLNAFNDCLAEFPSEPDQHPPIIATFQAGITKEFLMYFWNIWQFEELEQPSHKPVWINSSVTITDLPNDPSVLMLHSPFDQSMVDRILQLIDHHSACKTNSEASNAGNVKHVLMLVGDLEILLLHSAWIKPMIDTKRMKMINLTITKYDFAQSRQRHSNSPLYSFNVTRDLTLEYLMKSGGIPLVLHQVLVNYSEELIDVVLYRDSSKQVRLLLRHLFVMACKQFLVAEDWMFSNTSFSYLELADIIGLIRVNAKERLYADPNDALKSFEKSDSDAENKTQSYLIIWPESLKQRFVTVEPNAMKLLPGPGLTTPMQFFVAQNLTTAFKQRSTSLGERFAFLKHSFVKDLALSSEQPMMLPKILASDKKINLKWASTSPPQAFTDLTEVIWSDFHKLVDAVPAGRLLIFRPLSHSPGLMTVYRSYNKTDINILAFQMNSGKESLSPLDLLGELGKCPLTQVEEAPAYVNILFPQYGYSSTGARRYKLTFVFAAMNTTDLEKAMKAQGAKLTEGASASAGYIRCTRSSWKRLPDDVEVIILLRAGLIQLLGTDSYEFVEKYCATEIPQNEAATFLNQETESTDISSSDEPQLNLDLLSQAITGVSQEQRKRYVSAIRATFEGTRQLLCGPPMANSNAASMEEFSASPEELNTPKKRTYGNAVFVADDIESPLKKAKVSKKKNPVP